jgi:hypothetical protein
MVTETFAPASFAKLKTARALFPPSRSAASTSMQLAEDHTNFREELAELPASFGPGSSWGDDN